MNVKLLTLSALLTVFAGSGLSAEVKRLVIDPVHSSVGFKIRHTISKVSGSFENFTGEVHLDMADLNQSKAIATIDASSIDTNNEKRDDHLRNEDFFHVEKYGTIDFATTQWKHNADGTHTLTGDLTMHGVTLPVVIDVDYLGSTEVRGERRHGFNGKGKLDRTKFGMDGSTVIVGSEVTFDLDIVAVEKPWGTEEES